MNERCGERKNAVQVSGGKGKGQSTQEDRSKGSVSSKVYMTYLGAWGPGMMLPIIYISIALFDRTLNVCFPSTFSPIHELWLTCCHFVSIVYRYHDQYRQSLHASLLLTGSTVTSTHCDVYLPCREVRLYMIGNPQVGTGHHRY